MIPNEMSSGGLMGLCTVIQYATNGFLSASVLYLVSNVVLLLFAFAMMGSSFGFKTIYCIVMSTLMMRMVSGIGCLHAVEGSFLYMPERILVPIIAGLLEGVALGTIFRQDGSTGGMDIVALFVNRYWPISTGRFFLIADTIIITSIVFLPGMTFGHMMYGYIMMVCSTFMLDFITLGAQQSVQLLVFSEKYDLIADHIINELDRGVTVLKAQGWYTKLEKDVLLIVLRKKQLSGVTRLIKKVDPKAFVSVSQASSVYGEGFEEIKTGLKDNKKQ